MATKTTHLGLSKAELTDAVRSTLIANNGNFDKIDKAYAEVDNKIDEAIEKSSFYTLPEEGESQTIQTLYGDYVLTKKQSGAKTTYASTPVSENVNVPGIKSGNVSYSTSLENTAFNMTLNGVTNTIAFGSGEGIFSSANKSNIAPAFQDKIDNAFGANQIVVTAATKLSNYTISFASASESGHMPLSVSSINSETSSGYGDTLALLGIESGTSNILDIKQTVAKFLNTTKTNFSYTINSTTVTLPTSITIEAFFNSVNNCGEDVTIFYDIMGDKIVLEKNYYGKLNFSISDTIELFTALGISNTGYTVGSDLIVTMIDPYGKETEQKLLRDSFTTEDVLALVNVQMNQQKAELQGQIDRLRANQVQGSASGTEVVVQDAAEMESVIQLSGNSEQDSRSGKNIVDMSLFDTMNVNGSANSYDNVNHTITMDVDATNSAGRYKFITGLTVGKEYTISFDIRGTNGKKAQAGWDVSKTTIILTNDYIRYSKTITATSVNMGISFYSADANLGGLVTGEYMQFANVMITTDGSTDYEPYGVQPSPDYPSEIRSVKSKSDNLFDKNSMLVNDYYINVSEGIVKLAKDGSIIFAIPCEQNKTYTISYDFASNSTATLFRTGYIETETFSDATVKEIDTTLNSKRTLTVSGNAKYIVVQTNKDLVNSIKESLQVVKGTEALPYQPYGYVPVELKVEGNLFNKATTEDGKEIMSESIRDNPEWCISDYIPVEFGKNYVKNIENGNAYNIYNANKEKISGPNTNFVSNKITITDNNAKYIKVNLPIVDKEAYRLYAPDDVKTISLPLGDIQLRSTPDGTRDTFERVDGVWNKVDEIYSTNNLINILTDVNTYSSTDEYFGFNCGLPKKYAEPKATSLNVVSSILQWNSRVYHKNVEAFWTTGVSNRIYFSIKKSRLSDTSTNENAIASFKEWLTANPMQLDYVLAEPTYTPITDQALISALDELEQLILHKGYNYITATSVNGVKAQLDLSYIKDINTVLNNITAMIATIGGEMNV